MKSSGDLWAVTSYFNPMRYRSRQANYRVFRQHLKLPLLAVELAYGPDFELSEKDAEILVQLRGRDVLWQKERLLNIAVKALPSDCHKVVWVDCDIVFEADDWAERTSLMLDQFVLVQPFSHVHDMPQDWLPGCVRPPGVEWWHSIAFLVASGMPVPAGGKRLAGQARTAPGHVWAGHRQIWEQHHLYDACIIGGGDFAIARAAYGSPHEAMRNQDMNNRQKAHYLAWANPFYEAVRGSIGFIEGSLFHLWHGRLEHRNYFGRNVGLGPFDFDPFDDILIDQNGCWRWNTDKPAMHDYVRSYFESRKEDG